MREVCDASIASVATTSSSGDGASRWSESQNESSPHSSALAATSTIVAAEGSPRRKRPKPTPTLICFIMFSPAMLSHESVILTNSMGESPNSPAAVHLTFIGTGDAFASHGRFQSGYLIEGDGRHILMEAGPTVLCALKRMG